MENSRRPPQLLPLLLLAVTAAAAAKFAAAQATSAKVLHTTSLPGALINCRGVSQRATDGLERCLWHWWRLAESPGLVRYSPAATDSGGASSGGGCVLADWCDLLAVNQTEPVTTATYAGSRPRAVLFALRSGSQRKALDAFLTPAGCNQSLMFAPDPGQPPFDFWRSCWLDRLPELMALLPGKTISLEVLKANATVLKVTFNGSPTAGLNLQSWFNQSRLIGSEPDLGMAGRSYNFFSLVGSASPSGNPHNRTFYLNLVHNGCVNDAGIFGVMERDDDICAWGRTGLGGTGLPRILYNLNAGLWDNGVTLADSMLVTAA